MYLRIPKAPRVLRLDEPTAGQPRHCDTCGYHVQPPASETLPICGRCGSYLAIATDAGASGRRPLLLSWGDAIVVIGTVILAYFLAVMVWNALLGP